MCRDSDFTLTFACECTHIYTRALAHIRTHAYTYTRTHRNACIHIRKRAHSTHVQLYKASSFQTSGISACKQLKISPTHPHFKPHLYLAVYAYKATAFTSLIHALMPIVLINTLEGYLCNLSVSPSLCHLILLS
jgi:hypothetical protein